MIKIRRALIFIAFFIIIAAVASTNNFLVVLSAMPVVLLTYTDLCGKILFFIRGKKFVSWMNPLYVPDCCPQCGNNL